MSDYTFDDWQPDYGAAAPAPARAETRTIPSSEVRRKVDITDRKADAAGSWAMGLADTVTFGFLDELGAGADWLFLGKDYDTALAENRAILDAASEENGGAFFAGQMLGGFVPFMGWGGRVAGGAKAAQAANISRGVSTTAQNARTFAAVGAVQGALYGAGSADGDLFDRVKGAAAGGALGGVFGYTLGAAIVPLGSAAVAGAVGGAKKLGLAIRHGRPQKVLDQFSPDVVLRRAEPSVAGDLADAATVVGAKGAKKGTPVQQPQVRNIITGAADDVVEDGAVLSIRELTGDMGKARGVIAQRVAKMTTQEAILLAKRLEKAEALGTVVDDPHYRSLLGIDVSDTGVDADTAHRAAVLLEEATTAILEKAGAGQRSFGSIEDEFRKRFGRILTEDDIDGAADRAGKIVMDARVADHVAMLASVQFAKARSVFLPLVQKGDAEAKEQLASTIAEAISLTSRSNYIKSQVGRALGSLRMKSKLGVDEVVDGAEQIEDSKAIQARVRAALDEMDDTTLATMLKRARTTRDIDELLNTLNNVDDVKTVSKFMRMQRSMVSFVQSNLLSPATAMFNVAGFISHDLFRNHIAPRYAMFAMKRAGMVDEAFDLHLEQAVADRVYFQTHMAGMKAMMQRIQWDHWENVERIATLSGNLGKAANASGNKKGLLDAGYEPAPLREFDTAARAKVHNPEEFNRRIRELERQGGFARVWAAAQRAGAVGAEGLDYAGTLTAKVATGAVDSWGSNMVMLKETYRLSSRYAVREGRKAGLEGEALGKYVEKRAIELAEMPPAKLLREAEEQLATTGTVDEAVNFGLSVKEQAKKEADRVLFMDGPQTAPMKGLANILNSSKDVPVVDIVRTTLFPYVSTPARIFERGMVHYTPWGGKAREVQAILAKGGPEAAIELARMEVGSMVIGMGALMGAAGAITITNGGWNNTGQLEGKPSNRLNLPGGAYFEFGRLDPFAYSLALGGMLGQALKARDRDLKMGYSEEQAWWTAVNVAGLSFREAVLDKTYLTGFREAMQAFFQTKEGDSTSGIVKLGEELARTLAVAQVPLSGTSRQVADTVRGEIPETMSIMDDLLRLIPGTDLGVKRDWLGQPKDGRFMGINAGATDPGHIRQKLADMRLDLSDIEKRDRLGFRLTGKELDQLREIRATEATNSNGETLGEALAYLLDDPAFNALPTKAAREAAIQDVLEGLNTNAREIMEERNPGYEAKRVGYKSFVDYMNSGSTNSEARQLATEDVRSLGLPDPGL